MKVKDIIEIEKKYSEIKLLFKAAYEIFCYTKGMPETIDRNDALLTIGAIEEELDKFKKYIDEMEV